MVRLNSRENFRSIETNEILLIFISGTQLVKWDRTIFLRLDERPNERLFFQERFKTITTAYYRGAMVRFQLSSGNTLFLFCLFKGIMLVYDITSEKSFDNIKNWIRNIEEVKERKNIFQARTDFLFQHASAEVERMLIGNKCDMNDKRQVTREKGEQVRKTKKKKLFSAWRKSFPFSFSWRRNTESNSWKRAPKEIS